MPCTSKDVDEMDAKKIMFLITLRRHRNKWWQNHCETRGGRATSVVEKLDADQEAKRSGVKRWGEHGGQQEAGGGKEA